MEETDREETDWVRVYRESAYAFADEGGGWTHFALDGDADTVPGLDQSVVLITAWNPWSEERPLEENRARNRALAAALEEAGARVTAAYGASLPGTDPPWKEDGFAVHGWTREEAARWGRDWKQRALVWLDGVRAGLLFTREEEFVPCGVRLLDASEVAGA